jgi:hypothetical protein
MNTPTYFKKITSLTLPSADPDSVKGQLIMHYGHSRYYEISDKSFYDAIASSFIVPPKEIFLAEAIGPLNCHRDNGVTSCLNYYLRPSGYITEFWEPLENARRIRAKKYDAELDTFKDVLLGYEREDCVFKDSFVAESGDVYILDISKVHSVSHDRPSDVRSFVQCQWHVNVDELLKMLSLEI